MNASTWTNKRGWMSVLLVLLAAACSRLSPTPETAYLTPISQATIDAYQPALPLESRIAAVMLARRIAFGFRIVSVGDPLAIYAEKMSFEEAARMANPQWQGGNEAPADTPVWLVVFDGKWEYIGPLMTPQPYTGCAFALVAADDGALIGSGGQPCEKFAHEP